MSSARSPAGSEAGFGAVIASGVTPPDELGPLPEEWIVRPRLPQVAALRAMTSWSATGGNNTVMEALAAGLPVVALPFSTDQFAVAADVEAAGVGVALDPNRATAFDLAATVRLALGPGLDGGDKHARARASARPRRDPRREGARRGSLGGSCGPLDVDSCAIVGRWRFSSRSSSPWP